MKVKIFLIIWLVVVGTADGAGLFFEKYDWIANPDYQPLEAPLDNENAVYLKNMKVLEYYFDEDANTLLQLYTRHVKIQVNTHEAVERFNKQYLPMSRVLDIEDLRVRVVTRNKVTEIDNVDLKDYQDEDSGMSYKYFAIEGVEVGSQIEYIYTLKMMPQLEGSREIFQGEDRMLSNEFDIYCKGNMHFVTKSYNGFAGMQQDTTETGKNHYFARMSDIPPLKQEPYAPYQNYLMRVEYKLDHIDPADNVKLYTYSQLSNQLNNYLRADIDKKAVRELKKLSNELQLKGLTEKQKIRKIEDHLKMQYTVTEKKGDDLSNIESIVKSKVASQQGILKLYLALFDINDIPYEYGLTSDRSKIALDPDFESYGFLQNYVFYFPDLKKYMAPTEKLYRLGYIPYNWTNNYGLFVKNVHLGDTYAGIGKVKYIEPLAYNLNLDRLDISISFDHDFAKMGMDIKRTMTGYNATFLQPIFEFVPKDQTENVLKELLNLADKDVDITHYQMENASLDSFYLKPFIIKCQASTQSSFFSRAGNKYLFKIGELIGEQVEMYQENERQLPVENEFNRNYQRTITLTLPDGYRIRNLDDLQLDISTQEKDDNTMGFVSDYTQEGNKVIVNINEYYKQLDYPADRFEQFKKVINAAADFNKKVLVIEKI